VRRELTVRRAGAPPERRTIAGATTAGGSLADGLLLAGAPPAAALLVPAPPGIVVEARAVGVRVAGHAVPPGSRRLLRPGERAELHGASLSLEDAEAALAGKPESRDTPAGATRVAAAALLRAGAAGTAAVAGPRLVVLTGPAAGDQHALRAEQTLGRGRAATIRVADPRASRVHARIRAGAGGAAIEDLRSKNGVRVNGVPMDGRVARLRPGDEIAIGETVLVLEDSCPPTGTAQPAPAPVSRHPPPGRRGARAAAAALLALCAAALALAGS
jgi:FHA domain